jgi:hypothetical protein
MIKKKKKKDWKNENQNWIRKKLNEIKCRWTKKKINQENDKKRAIKRMRTKIILKKTIKW